MPIAPALPETSLVLDNDVFTHWRKGHQYVREAITDYIARLKKPPALSSITIFEALYGFEHGSIKGGSSDESIKQSRAHTERLIDSCDILPFDRNAAAIAAYVSARLSRREYNKHLKDVFIASTALAHRHGLVTQNKKDFELIAKHLPLSHLVLRIAIWKP